MTQPFSLPSYQGIPPPPPGNHTRLKVVRQPTTAAPQPPLNVKRISPPLQRRTHSYIPPQPRRAPTAVETMPRSILRSPSAPRPQTSSPRRVSFTKDTKPDTSGSTDQFRRRSVQRTDRKKHDQRSAPKSKSKKKSKSKREEPRRPFIVRSGSRRSSSRSSTHRRKPSN